MDLLHHWVLALAVAQGAETSTSAAVSTSTLSAPGSPAAALATRKSVVRVLGNRAVPEEVIRTLLDGAAPSVRQSGQNACLYILRFLRSAGYDHATARCVTEADQLTVIMDEGSIERVAFPGQSGLAAVAASVLFDLESRVFNRHRFREQVQRLEKSLGTQVVGYELGLADTDAASPIQLSDAEALQDMTGIPSKGRYVLAIHLERTFMEPGFGLGIEATGPDGLITELRYRWASLFMNDDRFKVGAEFGLRFSELLSGGSSRPLLSRGGAEVAWFSPVLLGQHVRGLVRARAAYLNRQRPDLDGASYDLLEPRFDAGLFWKPGELEQLELTVGGDYRGLLDSDLEEPSAQPTTTGALRAFVQVEGNVVLFRPERKRLDRSLTLYGRARAYATRAPYAEIRLTLEKGFSLGRYNEIRFETRGVTLAGDFGLIDEVRVSDLFRGLYGDRLYTSRAGTFSTEVFLSLERNRLRTSAFLDGIVLDPSERSNPQQGVVVGGSTGVGLHALFFETFQGSVYLLMGLVQGQELDGGFNFSLSRLF